MGHEQSDVGGNTVPRFQPNYIAQSNLFRVYFQELSVSLNSGLEFESFLQGLSTLLSPSLLNFSNNCV